jgi:adenylyltransferase/sulfurtransferase
MKIHIPTPLRQYAGKKDTIEVQAGSVGDALFALTTSYPDLRRHLYTDEGKLRAFVNVYLNDEDIRYLLKESTPVNENDSLSIVPSIAGGSCACCCACRMNA